MPMTIYDIAKEAKTSPSTVSRYLNNKPIQEDTKRRIEEVLKDTNFKPNAMARALVSKTLKTVAIITVDIRVPHFATVAYSFEQEFTKRGYNVIICNASGSVDKIINYITTLLERQIDGIAFVGSVFTQLNENADVLNLLNDLPVVVANGTVNLPNSYAVLVDDNYGISMAMDYLIQKGRKDIYYITDGSNDSATRKLQGFKSGCQRYEIDFDSHMIQGEETVRTGELAIKQLIDGKINFDAIVCGNDIVATGAINELSRNHIIVGRDVDVIGYNNTVYSEMTCPKMTIVNNKPDVQAKCLVDILENIINHKEVSTLTIKPELIIKESA